MTIHLVLIDERGTRMKRHEFQIPLPALPLSIQVAAKMAVQRARSEGLAGAIEWATVYIGIHYISPQTARTVFVPDNSVVTVTAFRPGVSSDIWELD